MENKQNDEIFVEVPCRIDFGGSTLDIFPLYHLHSPVITTNLAIDVNVNVKIESYTNLKYWELVSEDLGIIEKIFDINKMDNISTLELLKIPIQHYSDSIDQKFRLTTYSEAPKGSGLAASSALLIGVIKVLEILTSGNKNRNEIIKLAQHFETKLLEVPTGIQDYYPAVYGGLNFIEFQQGKIKQQNVPISEKFRNEIQERIILVHSGESHFSAIDNWNVIKSRIDRPVDPSIKEIFDKLAEISIRIAKACQNENINLLGKLVGKEWTIRSKIHPSLFNKNMKEIINCLKDYNVSFKGCGAGNGGVMMIFIEPEDRNDVLDDLKQKDYQVLSWKIKQRL